MPLIILVIEDSQTTLSTLTNSLEDDGYQVIPAITGEEGLMLFKKEEPDLTLTDIILPGIDGFEVCRQIKGMAPKHKVIITTAQVDAIDVSRARDVGADDFCVNTSDFEHVLIAIRKLMCDEEV